MTSLKSDLILAAFVLGLASAGPAWSTSAAGAGASDPVKKSTVKKATKKKVVAKMTQAKKVAARKPVPAPAATKPDTGTTLTAEVTPVAALATAAVAAPMVIASVSETLPAPSAAPASTNPYLVHVAKEPGNPYLAAMPAASAAPVESRSLGADLRAFLPSLPGEGQSFLPSIKKVYPTGEKPLVVITFKCPTELVGVTPPPVKLLHSAVDGSFQALNATDWLSFDLQQVCQ